MPGPATRRPLERALGFEVTPATNGGIVPTPSQLHGRGHHDPRHARAPANPPSGLTRARKVRQRTDEARRGRQSGRMSYGCTSNLPLSAPGPSTLAAGCWMPAARCHASLGELALRQRQVARGESLYHQGDPLVALYEVQAGQFKSGHADVRGRHQITGFKLAGELLGLDAIGTDRHCVEAVALDTALVSIIPYPVLIDLLQQNAAFRNAFNKVMGHEIVRDQAMMLLLGTTVAERRVAAFVVDLAGRLQGHGQPAALLSLCMSRHDIGSYLGLTLETVSRTLSKLQGNGVIGIDRRQLRVLDVPALRRIAQGAG